MKKKIFITGVTGTMGSCGLAELVKRRDDFEITALVRDSAKNHEKMAEYEKLSGVTVYYGDLSNYDDVRHCVLGADYVLHVAAFISPKADYQPDEARRSNVDSTANIIKAIKELQQEKSTHLVYIGSVAETGDRMPPLHWGRVGDPLKPSIYDNYAVTKIEAERMVIDSGLAYWVSLRQTGILYTDLLNVADGINFHQPLENCLEWVTNKDSGVLLANVCADWVAPEFWNHVYNIGGGPSCRVTNYEFLLKTYQLMGVKDLGQVYERSWFATRNFHGQWYEDSDLLEDYLHFRSQSMDDFLLELKASLGSKSTVVKLLPKSIIKKKNLQMARTSNGTVNWLEKGIATRIKAFYGSLEAQQAIGSFQDYHYERPSDTPIRLDHGYDESKPASELDIDDMRQAAAFRGGQCLSESMTKGDMRTPLQWQCALGHTFWGSPELILKAGHWCPDCTPTPWDYAKQAEVNPFFRQVWEPIWGDQAIGRYERDAYKDIME